MPDDFIRDRHAIELYVGSYVLVRFAADHETRRLLLILRDVDDYAWHFETPNKGSIILLPRGRIIEMEPQTMAKAAEMLSLPGAPIPRHDRMKPIDDEED